MAPKYPVHNPLLLYHEGVVRVVTPFILVRPNLIDSAVSRLFGEESFYLFFASLRICNIDRDSDTFKGSAALTSSMTRVTSHPIFTF